MESFQISLRHSNLWGCFKNFPLSLFQRLSFISLFLVVVYGGLFSVYEILPLHPICLVKFSLSFLFVSSEDGPLTKEERKE